MTKCMRMKIAERHKPFSHQSGKIALLPKTTLGFQVFPAAIRVYDLSGPAKSLKDEMTLPISGIVEGFTLQQDLEKGCLRIWGTAKEGYFRFRIEAISTNDYSLILEKAFPGLTLPHKESSGKLPSPLQASEVLSFGVSKQQNWESLHLRQQLSEILPLWFRLGQWTPTDHNKITTESGTLELLKQARRALNQSDSAKLAEVFRKIYLAGFNDFLVPSLTDERHQGFNLPPLNADELASPLVLLSEGKSLIKQMLINENSSSIQILPCLPAEFHCGRLLNASLLAGVLNMEWSKKTIRRMSFTPAVSGKLIFEFPKDIKTFRLKRNSDDSVQLKICGEAIEFSSTDQYFFDNFKH